MWIFQVKHNLTAIYFILISVGKFEEYDMTTRIMRRNAFVHLTLLLCRFITADKDEYADDRRC